MGYGDSQIQISDSTAEKKRDIRMLDREYRQRGDDVQEETRRQDTYHLTKELGFSDLNQQDRRNAYQQKHFSSIREAIRDNISRYTYRKYDRAVTTGNMNSDRRKLKLHHALGQKFSDEGKNVLEIDVAGSSFDRFRKEYAGFHGKNGTDFKGYAKERAARLADFAGISRFNVIKRYMLRRKIQGQEKAQVSEHMRQVYGDEFHAALDKKTKFSYRKLTKQSSASHLEMTRYSLSGPVSGVWKAKGLMDAGEYNIEHLKSYVLTMVQDYIYEHLNNGTLDHELVINLQGHSRGGVAVGAATHALSEWLNSPECASFGHQVKINLIQRDPVPGPHSRLKYDHGKMDLRVPDQNGVLTHDKHINVSSLVSMHTEHEHFFLPQNVRGQQRIVVMHEKHGVGMDQVDGSQKDASGVTKYHEMAGIDAATMEAYRGSGYSELGGGVWLMDEDNVLVRVRSYGEAMAVLRQVGEKNSSQKERHQIVAEMIKNWFIDNDFVDEHVTADEYKEDLKAKVKLEDELAQSAGPAPESEEMKRVCTAASVLRQVMDLKSNTAEEFAALVKTKNMAIEEAIEACKDYMEKNSPLTDTQVDGNLEKVSKLLSIYRQEKAYLESLDDMTFADYQQKGSPVMKTYLDWLNN